MAEQGKLEGGTPQLLPKEQEAAKQTELRENTPGWEHSKYKGPEVGRHAESLRQLSHPEQSRGQDIGEIHRHGKSQLMRFLFS